MALKYYAHALQLHLYSLVYNILRQLTQHLNIHHVLIPYSLAGKGESGPSTSGLRGNSTLHATVNLFESSRCEATRHAYTYNKTKL